MKKKTIVKIATLAIAVAIAFFVTKRLTSPDVIICRVGPGQANLRSLGLAVSEYIARTHQLPSWGVSFTKDLRHAELIEHPNREIYDPWGGKYSLTLTEDGTSLLIVSAGEDRAFGTKDDLKHRLNINPNQELEPTSLDAD